MSPRRIVVAARGWWSRAFYRCWPELDPAKLRTTDSGLPEKRRQHYVTVETYRLGIRRVVVMFLALGVVSSAASYLGYSAGQSSEERDAVASNGAVYETCLAGAETLTAVAVAIDTLRTSAVPPEVRPRFVRQTQIAIDQLLTRIAGSDVHAPLPPGSVSDRVQAEVLGLAVMRCRDRADRQYPEGAPDPQ